MPPTCIDGAGAGIACIMNAFAAAGARLLHGCSTPNKLQASAGPDTIGKNRKNNDKDETA
jgi:hypothetical protein